MREYKLISGDGHINEPPNLWKERLPKKFQERAPRMQRFEKGDAWIFDGVKDPINFGNNISGGLPYEQHLAWKRWEEARPAGFDPKARLAMQDEDRVDAEIMYPTPRPSSAVFNSRRDPEFHVACIRAYNDWLAEFCGYAPDRLVGAAMIPTSNLEEALEELDRTMKVPGMGSPLLGMWPSAGTAVSPDDDRFWAACLEMGVPVSIHVSLSTGESAGGDGDPDRRRPGARGELRHINAPLRCLELIQAGVFDRFPKLQVVFAETDSSWVPYVKEQFDDRFKRQVNTRPKLNHNPSYYFDHNIFTTYITDRYAVINRREIGVTQFMWSSDYPHIGADFPNSWKTINEHFKGVPEDEKHLILAGNAARVYKIGNGE